jgi:hypothetical protein
MRVFSAGRARASRNFRPARGPVSMEDSDPPTSSLRPAGAVTSLSHGSGRLSRAPDTDIMIMMVGLDDIMIAVGVTDLNSAAAAAAQARTSRCQWRPAATEAQARSRGAAGRV